MVLCTVWDYEAPNYQFITNLKTRTNVEFTTKPQMGYSTCYAPFLFRIIINLQLNEK